MIHAAVTAAHAGRSFGARAAALDFPPAGEKLDEWRATIRSLVAVTNKDDPRPAGPSVRRSTEPPHAGAGRTGGVVATVHSPPPRQPTRALARGDDACDDISIASSDPRTRRDQRQVLRERAHEDARTTIERRRDTRHQSDKRAGPAMDHPAPGGSGGLRYEVGCPAFTHELRRGRPTANSSPTSTRSTLARPIRPSSLASTPSRCRRPKLATTRCLPIISRWH